MNRQSGEVMSVEIADGVSTDFCWIPPGEFEMGSPDWEDREFREKCEDAGPMRTVTFAEGFWIGRFEVTEHEWESVMGTPPTDISKYPKVGISWYDAKEFVARLNERCSEYIFALPSEAQWEYAARAGHAPDRAANFRDIELPCGGSMPVGPLTGHLVPVDWDPVPNRWGLHFVNDNAHEWVEDFYRNSYEGAPTDGSANTIVGVRGSRVYRGGSYGMEGILSMTCQRSAGQPDKPGWNTGLRLSCKEREP